MNRKNILLLFDVDGTLTKPRQVISDKFRSFLLEKVLPLATVGVVSGSDFPKITEQLTGADVAAQLDYVFCENGLVHYRNGVLKSQESILSHMGEQKLQKLINFSLGYLSTVELPAKRGNFVEFRSSMINISPIGRSCSQAERDQFVIYDTEHKVREKLIKALQKEFEGTNLTVALGGQISVDVFPIGWDKTFCLRHVEEGNFKEVHFFGDRTMPGGNDHEIFMDDRTIGHTVTSPEDTEQKLKALLKLS